MTSTPKGFRIHIGIFGRRNVGKSSLLNALAGQQVAIVSDVPGTTTDPVEKAMEFAPLGPVVFVDTAGVDDTAGALGASRVERTERVFDRVDVALLVFVEWGEAEERLWKEFERRGIPCVGVRNKADEEIEEVGKVEEVEEAVAVASRRAPSRVVIPASALTGEGLPEIRRAIVRALPDAALEPRSIVGDLISPGQCAVLVVPIDAAAPKGRLILPQVNVIRDVLDQGATCVVVKDDGLKECLQNLSTPPAVVITDSQVFGKVATIVPESIPLTSFSILFARYRADLTEMVRGAEAIRSLRPGDKILIAEACTHHATQDDIGTVKIPQMLEKAAGGRLVVEHARGHDFPKENELKDYKLIVHCGACVWNRREMLSRQLLAREAGVPMTNYGVAIAAMTGVLERITLLRTPT